MCGILGIHDLTGGDDLRRHGDADSEVLRHRGPDDQGFYVDQSVFLAQRRLSIIDLESGHQPMFNEDGSVCIVFNGEIYNFQDLRRELEARGHRFNTRSDTETVVHAYEEYGDDCVNRLRGMFAFAIWDRRRKRLLLARDRIGIKPLYHAQFGGKLYFSSELKGILQHGEVPRQISRRGLVAFFSLTYIPAPLTIFQGIHKLPPGHVMVVEGGKTSIRQYWDLRFAPDDGKSSGHFADGVRHHLEEAVRLRMISDVPLGAFLSGGIDSGAVAALMSRHASQAVQTFCIGFGGDAGGYLDERQYARQVSEMHGTQHTEYQVQPNVVDIIDELVDAFDEPFGDASTVPSYYVSQMTRKHVKVALSGLGGDEMFGGYERYLGFKLGRWYQRLPAFLRGSVVRKLVERLPERADGHYTVNHLKRFVRYGDLPDDERYLGFVSHAGSGGLGALLGEPAKFAEAQDHCRELMLGYFNADNATDPLDRAFYMDLKTYVPEDILACTDRTSMWHSLEVRVPFLDHELMEFCATIPNRLKIRGLRKKHLLKSVARQWLPREVIDHRKQGFIGPMTRWLRTDLRTYVEETLGEKRLAEHGLFSSATVKQVVEEHFNRTQIHDKLIWSLVMFQRWYDRTLGAGAARAPRSMAPVGSDPPRPGSADWARSS